VILEEHAGTWTYDAEVRAAYLYLRGPIAPGGVARTVTVDSAMVLHLPRRRSVSGRHVRVRPARWGRVRYPSC
jgi:hypothetical protein